MKKKTLISIIIPVYNGEKYLKRCLDSILSQTYENWELLLIDDGSTDLSSSICDDYTSDARISVIHRQNGGQATARNEGIVQSKGEYVSFVDCDDWLEPDMYESMIRICQLHKVEIVACGYIEEYKTRRKEVQNDGSISFYGAEEAVRMVLEKQIVGYPWSMLFHRSVLKEPMADLTPFEDYATIFKWVSHVNRIAVWHKAFYHYRQLDGSSLHSFNIRKERNFMLAVRERYHYIQDKELLPGYDAENRRLYLCDCIKLAKDLARSPYNIHDVLALISELRDELLTLQPIFRNEVGTKYYIRLRILLANVNLFVRILRVSSFFSIKRWVANTGLFN